MAKKFWIIGGSLIGLGATGYYAYRAYQNSDHTVRGTFNQCGKEFMNDMHHVVNFAQRVIGQAPEKLAGFVESVESEGNGQRQNRKRNHNKFGDEATTLGSDNH